MFVKTIEFVMFQQNKLKAYTCVDKKFISVLTHVLALGLGILFISLTAQYLVRSCLFGVAYFFIIYWFVSIFTYLYKKSLFGTYTRIIQRFWKRALYLFWLIEVSLFCIYLFLTLISPQEVAYMLDNIQLFFFFNGNLNIFFQVLLNVLLLILLGNFYILLYKYDSYVWYVPICILIVLLGIFYNDFIQFYNINQYYNGWTWVHNKTDLTKKIFDTDYNGYDHSIIGVWEFEVEELKVRTYMHYIYLLIFLKLWHTFFILMYFLFFENIRIITNINSYNVLSSFLQNFYFLLFFNYILKIIMIKHFGLYVVEYVYYWFFINYHFYDLTVWVFLEGLNYLYFLIIDFFNYFK